MKQGLFTLGLSVALSIMAGCRSQQEGWKLVWEENFDQEDHFDEASWSKIPRGKSDWNNYMSDFDSCYTMRDGNLVLRGLVNYSLPADTAPFITGGVYTKGKVGFSDGRLDIRAKLYGATGAWPAFWLLPEKDALDYFINNAGSPNGVIDGGLAIFASGNEYAGMAAFPAAYSKCISVSAVAADFTPASYSNYGKEVTISAPGGDTEYYNPVGQDDPEGWEEGIHSGSILSTWIQNGNATYGFMDGTSMACPHVSGVAALGLSYAVKQRRHFKASEFVELLKSSTKPLDSWYNTGEVKAYYRNHISSGASATRVELSKYVGKMGAGLLDAGMLLNNIEGNGSDMVVPNMYVAEGAASTLNLACYFVNGENLTYTCTSGDTTVASVSVNGTFMTVSGVKTGATRITVKVSNGSEQSITVTVRKKANDNGWM